ncbi:unnamed protein product [Brachionus calyciflorus]|uniref:Ral GTPase-activating protein subunit alpha/beta N-terminal domain-containing protein n=1 Tax=Brachionus calyciflorus TaxID=104777 RepID=A0A813SGE4_9BILA|nr:unnamed protein product [Brachionus calyciflorus]
MFSNYTSLKDQIEKEIENQKSVLNKFPESISRPITQSCSKHLAQFTSFQLPFKDHPPENFQNDFICLETPEQVNWILENLMYGLQLSHEYQDIIKDCWNIYHDWLSILLDEPKLFLPQPIKDNPRHYARKMLWHLYHLFVPRGQTPAPTKHVMMCHGVLVLIETIAKDSKLLDSDLWEEFLKFFLAINNAVLSPPFQKDDFGEVLSTRIIATLFEIWLIACHKVFPSPSLWKTFHDLCSNWRHHMSLITEWNRVVNALTSRVLELFNDNKKISTINTPTSTTTTTTTNNNNSNISNSINDTNVAYDIQNIINSMNRQQVVQSWIRFMHIIGRPIDFMDTHGMIKNLDRKLLLNEQLNLPSQITTNCVKKLPLIHLEYLKSVSKMIETYLKTQSICSVNSLLDLFGVWLFETVQMTRVEFANGQAEAIGCLCRIFCCLKTGEKVNMEYLSRFYSILTTCLNKQVLINDEMDSCECLFSIIINCVGFYRVDLDGSVVLLGAFLNAVQSIFKLKYTQKEQLVCIGSRSVSLTELKRSTIQLFSQIISLNLVEYKSRILEIYLSGMSNESDSLNLQLLFACGKLLIGEWVLDECKMRTSSSSSSIVEQKKEKALYCYNQIVSLICAPLKVNANTLQNHSFALCIFDCLTSIVSADYLGILNENDNQITKIAISWIWNYIKSQIKRRSRDHTKEMHSVICSAYQCLISILITRPDVLKDKQTLQTVTNCIEIGISGSSSLLDSELVYKWDKELKPASLRVKEAAECVLFYLMEYQNQSNDLRQPLSEKDFVDLVNTPEWKFYALDNSVIVSILDRQLLNKECNMSKITPQVILIARTAFNRQAWLINQRQSSLFKMHNKLDINYKLNKTITELYEPFKKLYKYENYLAESQNVPKCELSIPSIGDISTKLYKNVLPKFEKIKKEQIDVENEQIVKNLDANKDIRIHSQLDESLNMKNCAAFETSSRIFLTNLGLVKLDAKLPGDFVELSNVNEAILDLDNVATRTYSQAFIFYVRSNKTSLKLIQESLNLKLNNQFYEFVNTLGNIVSVNNSNDNKKLKDLNGLDSLIYWSDICNELSFILPNNNNYNSLTTDFFKTKSQTLPNDLKVLIVWLENIQDFDHLPIDEMVMQTDYITPSVNMGTRPKEIIVIFIHPLKNKLNRITIWSNLAKKYYYTMPLIDGMVVSSRMLSSMIRQTALNIFRRKRLEIDDYQPPHVRRKNKIAEIIKKHQIKKPEPELYTSFLMGT